jgi:hypothetical protein
MTLSSARSATNDTAVFRLAQQQATDRLTGPVPQWKSNAGGLWHKPRKRWAILLMGLVAVVSPLALHAIAGGRPMRVLLPAPIPATHPAALFEMSAPVIVAAVAPAPMPPAPPTAAVPGRGDIQQVGAEIHIELAAMPLERAVQMLALATDASVNGLDSLATQMRPITMKWQGRSAAEAWHLLLASDVSYAAQCRGARCDVWLAGALAPSAAAPSDAPMRLHTPVGIRSEPQPAAAPQRLAASDEATEIAAFGVPQ